ncbi:MAG TPA: hypothetical protein VGV34_04115, partial [Solirubrobacterales bacterium]|nr:hypothetical protein [Solirubrobacterales bacterium]
SRPAPSSPAGRDSGAERSRQPATLHQITDEVIATGFDPAAVGRALIELAERDNGIEAASSYAGILAKAILSRRDREQPR